MKGGKEEMGRRKREGNERKKIGRGKEIENEK